MLNAFNAHSIFEVSAKDRFRIDSLLAYGDKLILGLSTGTLKVYRVHSPDTPDVSLSHIQTIETFSRRKIEVLACIKEAGILVSLSDTNVHIHDLNDFTLTETLTKARGATVLAVTSNVERDPETQIPSIVSRLAIGVKRKVLLYSWADGGFQEGKEVTLGGQVKSLTWASGHKIVVGLTGSFVMVDVDTASVEDILPLEHANGAAKVRDEKAGWGSYVGMGGWGSKSLSTRLSGDELLLVRDSNTLFINTEGKPLDRAPIQWPTPPDAIAYSYPYLISLNTTKQQIEVRNPTTRTLLQNINLPTVAYLHVPPPNVALQHAGKLFFVASPTQVWRMGSTDYETQINDLVEAGQLDEAIRLVETLESVLLKENKEERLREVQMLKAQRLFQKHKYEESMALFAQVSAPPERVVKLFPKEVAGDISIWSDEGHESDGEEAEEPAPTKEREEEPTNENGTKDDSNDDEPNEKEKTPEPKSPPRTPKSSKPPSPTTPSPTTPTRPRPKAGPSKSNGEASQPNGETVENGEASEPKPTDEKPLDTIAEDSPPLEKIRSNETVPELRRAPTEAFAASKPVAFTRKYGGETASIFSFGTRRTAYAASVANNDNQPVDDTPRPLEGEELKKAAQELARTYLNDVRRKLTKYFDPEGNPVDPLTILSPGSVHEASMKDPLESSFLAIEEAPSSGAVPPSPTSPINPAVERVEKLMETCRLVDTTLFRCYMLIRPALVGPLVRLPNQCDPDVVSQKLREQGKFDDLVYFLERKKLHREALELLRFFGQAEDMNKAPSLHGPQRTITYLERLKSDHIDLIFEFSTWPLKVEPKDAMEVFVGDTGNSESLPRPAVLDYLEKQNQDLAIQYLEHIVTELQDMTPEFHTRLAGLYLTVLGKDNTPLTKASWQSRFLKFLETSDQYRAEKVLSWLPRDAPEFYECRAIVLSKMGRHKAALEIYVFKLGDHEKAEEYCRRVHLAGPSNTEVATESAETVYHTLLSLYLQPPVPQAQQLEPALRILSRHGARLKASEALKLVPENVRVKDLESYFESRIRAANATVTENRIIAALRKSHIVDVQEQLLDARNSHVTVGEESVCPVCHKRLGLSVIWRLPTGQVVHYGCAKKATF